MSQEVGPLESTNPDRAWRAAQAFGFDMDLLKESLELSPDERLRLHEIALRRLTRLEAAFKDARSGHRPPA